MEHDTELKLANRPSLKALRRTGERTSCKICGARARFFDVCDFSKCTGGHPFGHSGVEVAWYRCPFCDFLFTTFFDDWTPSDFSRFVYNSDYIIIDPGHAATRPFAMASKVASWLEHNPELRLLDYGSGSGVMAEKLRGRGFNAEVYDPFYSPARPTGKFNVVTCIEVIEHCPDPMAAIADMAGFLDPRGGCLVLCETVQPPDIAMQKAGWWYCAPRNGHCSTFSRDTLAIIAGRLGFTISNAGFFFCLSSGAAAPFAGLFGEPYATVSLGAPRDARAIGWQGIEDDARWTAERTISWNMTTAGTAATVRLPVLSEICPGFAKECRFEVDGEGVDTSYESGILSGVANFRGGAASIVLITPEPLSPRELRGGADYRRLGLMIPIG